MSRGQLGAGRAVATLLVLAVVALLVVRGDGDRRLTAAGSVPVPTVTAAPSAAPSTVPAPTTPVAPAPASTASSAPAAPAPAATAPPAPVTTVLAGDSLTTTAGAHGPMQAALMAARQRWQAGRPAQGYVWVYERSCRCSPRKVEAAVDGRGSVLSARALDRGAANEPVVGALTVDAVLAQLQEAIDGNAASIGARFDPVLGLPSSSSVDRSTAVADEERGLSISAFSPRSER